MSHDDALFESVYQELKRIARSQLRGATGTLNATALVNETWLKLAGSGHGTLERTHFISLFVRAMRQILIDNARRRDADKRGGGQRPVTLDASMPVGTAGSLDVLALEQALDQLRAVRPRLAEVVEMHFYGGIEFREIAELLSLTERTVQRDWQAARALLGQVLSG